MWILMNYERMRNPVAAMNVKWAELYWDILGLVSLAWRNPIYFAYFVFFAPRLLRMVMFFCPLLISTCLLMLVIFSLGPQLERIRIESDLQWKRFREASWRDDKRLRVMKGVKWPVVGCRDLWVDLLRGLHVASCESGLLSEDPFLNEIEEEGVKFDLEKCEGAVLPMAESKTLDAGQSVILGKIRVFMGKLVAELGGKVECDVLNALEAIAEAFIETTQSHCEEDIINSSNSVLQAAKDRESCDKPLEEVKTLNEFQLLDKSDLKEKNVGIGDECPLIEKENVGIGDECPLIEKENVESQTHVVGPLTKEKFPQVTDVEACEKEIDASTFDSRAFEAPVVVPETLLEESCTAKLSGFSQVSGKGNGVVDSDQADPSDSENGHPSLENCVFRSCRSLPLENSQEDFLAMDKLWEEDDDNIGLCAFEKTPAVRKEKDWKRTLACKLYEEQQNRWRGTLAGKFCEERSSRFHSQLSPLVKIPEHQSYTDFFSAKSTSSSSDSPAFTSAESPLNAEEMDLLWEEYNDAQSQDPESRIKGLAKSLSKLRNLRANVDSDTDEDPETSKLCCLKAFRFSPGKIPLRKPNLVKFSKALKNFGFIQYIQRAKTAY